MSKIIILGANGMLATAIVKQLTGCDVRALTSKQLDITCTQKVQDTVASFKPDYIINCAAYTAVDLAETEKAAAYKINALAVEKLAQIASHYNATLVHFSTDYVFNGNANAPYKTNTDPDPINVYGASKLAGEEAIRTVATNYYIFRVSWLYAPHGKNFFKWVATTDLKELNVVDTQTGSPTSALNVAGFIAHVIKHDPQKYGTYHLTNAGSCTWFAFAKAIQEKLHLDITINPIQEYKTTAQRPVYSVMDSSETQEIFNYNMKTWENGLDEVAQHHKS